MKKFKIFYNFKEEEKWLKDMAKKGHILKSYSVFGIYTFTDGLSQDLNYKIDYKLFKKKSDYVSYLTLFEDYGWKHVCGTKNGGNHYFLPKNKETKAEIFSDSESSNMRYKTLYKICFTNLILCVLFFISMLSTISFSLSNLGFLTPGLWEKVGVDFWKSFFFELPFVIERIALWLIVLVIGIAYGYWAIKAKQEYDAHKNE
ncbi:DUF2812 domain-containing protein [Clostridium sp. BJN0001]|uniref:DUF2812 domain-containing protein n=1 Tax=Clostridium sp. BJN0001 TaxID=2930219 RepID=UPI001FD58EF2|nr:DUF2812 domain-containing protein [Clostridium sp. BJN0001]